MMKNILFLVFIFMLSGLSNAKAIDKSLFQDYDTALVIHNRSTKETVHADPSLSARRLSPCSTFKIYNTLIGLELGLIKGPDDPWYHWDGIVRDIEGWNQDLTLREAFRVSAVPAYQILARQIGAEKMQHYIDQIGYGTQDISAGIDTFWLDRAGAVSIMISAQEQVELLNRFLNGELPFSSENGAILREVMRTARTEKARLYGKTGSGRNIGWFVGFLEYGDTIYVFACQIIGGENPSGRTARGIVENVFRSQGLL
jgi:beta-lactamase class D